MTSETKIFRAGISPLEQYKRIAPIRSYLYNYAFCKSLERDGEKTLFVVKCDDTDKKKHGDKNIFWSVYDFYTQVLGTSPDIDPKNSEKKIGASLFQSERLDIYRMHQLRLIDQGMAYVDKETKTLQFNIEQFANTFSLDTLIATDVLLGEISFSLIDILSKSRSFSIVRANGTPLYNFASMVDDHELGVTHVVRGQDKISSLPFQEMIRVALGFKKRIFMHTPLLTDTQGKRLRGDTSFQTFLHQGISFEALLTYVITSGYGDASALYSSVEELVSKFDFQKVHHKSGAFDHKKMESTNRKLVGRMDMQTYLESVCRHLNLTGGEEFKFLLNSERQLREFIGIVRPDYINLTDTIKRFLNPSFDMLSEDQKCNVNKLRHFLEANSTLSETLKFSNMDNTTFYSCLSWLLLGKYDSRGSKRVYDYFSENKKLNERLILAGNRLSE